MNGRAAENATSSARGNLVAPPKPISRFDAWVLARVISDQPLNGELSMVSDQFRSITEHLAALPAGARLGALNAYLCGKADSEGFALALAEQDPLGPPPELEVEVEQPKRYVMRSAAEIEALPVEWVWQDRVPEGC